MYLGKAYYFRKNLQGDVIAITDKDGQTVARYTYDAWGVPAIVQDVTEDAIATVNPYRYRSYYYDTETGMYYLQSRYYDPVTGRFINADETFFLVIGHSFDLNIFTYCTNDPIQKCDTLGYVSYKNTIAKNNVDVITKLSGWFVTLKYKYKVDNGIIRFEFANNNYWSALWRGWAKTLAEAMYKAAKSISSSYLMGRTITGIHIELFVHWALYKLGIKRSSTERADMGGIWGTGKDNNAWVFEVAGVINRFEKSRRMYNVFGFISVLRDIARYF